MSAKEEKEPVFSVVATTALGAVGGKKTSECFRGDLFIPYRDSDLDVWLPEDQLSTGPCPVSALAPSRAWTFMMLARFILGIRSTGLAQLIEMLIESGYAMTLTQFEAMAQVAKDGVNTGMQRDGFTTFYFVKSRERDGRRHPWVGAARYIGSQWFSSISRADLSHRQSRSDRILVPNFRT